MAGHDCGRPCAGWLLATGLGRQSGAEWPPTRLRQPESVNRAGERDPEHQSESVAVAESDAQPILFSDRQAVAFAIACPDTDAGPDAGSDRVARPRGDTCAIDEHAA
jgi:hypothetical protein